MKYLKRFNEKISFRNLDSDHREYTQDDIENLFNISIDEIEDIVSDVLDENLHLSCRVSIWDSKMFTIGFYIEAYGEVAKKWLFERNLVTKYVNDIKHRLNSYGLIISDISGKGESADNTNTFAVNLFISKMDKNILESNNTQPNEENLLQKYFDITSDDIKIGVRTF